MSDNWYVAPAGVGVSDGNLFHSGSSRSKIAEEAVTITFTAVVLNTPALTWADLGVLPGMKITLHDGDDLFFRRTILSIDEATVYIDTAVDVASYTARVGGPVANYQSLVDVVTDGDVIHIAPGDPGDYPVEIISPPMSAQQIRDAMLLAPSATPAPAAESIDDQLRVLALSPSVVRVQ